MKQIILRLISIGILGVQLFALTDAELIALRDGFDGRRDAVMASQISSPWPDPATSDWGMQNFALAAFYHGDATDWIAANQTVIDACAQIKSDQAYYDDVFHWRGNLFYRIYKFFGHDSDYYPGRLSLAAEDAIFDIFWHWAKHDSELVHADTANSKTWFLWGSENHDAMRKTTSYSAADILKDNAPYNTYTYDDGSTAQQQYDAWNDFFKMYLRERAKKGLLVEIASNGYGKYTLQGWYNFFDFAPDDELKQLAGMTLDIWWADWSLEQIGGVRGGGKTRIYQDRPENGLNGNDLFARDDSTWGMVWYYLNMGASQSKHPGVMCLATSEYRIPLVVMDIALDISGRGTYEFKSRRPGRILVPAPASLPAETYGVDADNGGIYRYTYVAPEFVIGSLMFEKRPLSDWSAISTQNRWQGVIFANHDDARIIPQCEGLALTYGKTYNQYWSLQHKGSMITQRLEASYLSHTGDMRVYLSGSPTGMTVTEEDGWIFAQLPDAYAAVKSVWSSYVWEDDDETDGIDTEDKWIRLADSTSPVIIEVAQAANYASFANFKTAIKALPLAVNNDVLTYTGLDGAQLTFYTATTQLPEVDGTPIDLQPSYTFESPFMNEAWATGDITIAKDGREKRYNFDDALTGRCGEFGYLVGDINLDCFVDNTDVVAMGTEWLDDQANPVSDSDDYPTLVEAGWALSGNYNIPKTTIVPTVDGVVATGEWMDARRIEMVYPAINTLPNTGTLFSGTTPPDYNGDFSIYWHVKWDANNLYLLGVIYDDIIDPLDQPGLCLNPLNQQPAAFPGDLVIWELAATGAINSLLLVGPTASQLSGSVVPGDHYVLEMQIPWSDFNAPGYVPTVGHEHGFGLLCQDYDAGSVREHYFLDFGFGNANVVDASTWNTITLVDAMPAGEAGVSDADLNGDYNVDLFDFSQLWLNWMTCNDPVVLGCVELVPEVADYLAPYLDDVDTVALWHIDNNYGNRYLYNDASVTGLDRRIYLSPHDPYTAPTRVNPATAPGLDFPADNNSEFGHCLHFNGVDQDAYAPFVGATEIDESDVSIEGWFNPDVATDGQKLFCSWGMMGIFTNSTKLSVQLWDGIATPTYNFDYAPLGINASGEWIHFAVDVIGTEMKVYLNGERVGAPITLAGALQSATKPVHIGKRYQGSNRFTGYIDEIRIAKASVTP